MPLMNPLHRRLATLTAVLVLTTTITGHSWAEYAQVLDLNGTMIGEIGYPRGYLPRNSTEPLWADMIPQWLLPLAGQSAYSGNEILNEYLYDPNPKYPMLQAAPGDRVAIIHLENGHVSLPQNQPYKPHNRGTIFIYGTSNPKPQEKLFDVHLLWNKDGTGGDKRGKLLATRNFDDGQCYQPNNGDIATDRSSKLASQGAKHYEELACQSDLQLPDDLKPGSVYTIYWYWDWPDLNPAKINAEDTANGQYPWAGSFMRGDKLPKGWTMDMISKNESYSSSLDINIVAKDQGATAKVQSFIENQDIYKMGVPNQMDSNYQVDVKVEGGMGSPSNASPDTTSVPAASTQTNPVAPTQTGAGDSQGGVTTVTMFSTVPPTTLVTTVFVTLPSGEPVTHGVSTPTDIQKALPTSTVVVTQTAHVTATGSQTPTFATSQLSTPTTVPGVLIEHRARGFFRKARG